MNEIDRNAALGTAAPAAKTETSDARQEARAPAAPREPERDTVRVEALIKATASRLVTDEATRVVQVEILDPATRACRVTVPDYQLSLAIGKEGQNARLAAKLTGWKIDIKSESQAQTLE